MSDNILEVSEDNFGSEVMFSNGRVVVDFYSDSCGPCQYMAGIINEI